MFITDYLNEIEFAVANLMPAIWGERARLVELEKQLTQLTRVVEDNYRQAESIYMNAEDPEEVAMAAGVHWENYFGDDKERFHKNQDRERLQDQIVAHAFSVGSLSCALLQLAKQGISLGHGGLEGCPNGRSIGTQAIKVVIWQGRNQSIHWEEDNSRPAVEQCFDTLAREKDAKFVDYKTKNMAFDIVELLGWKTVDDFTTDMQSLA